MIKKRYPEIDALYTIGIFLVLIGHSHSSDGSYGNTILHDAVTFIYTFHMPLFFVIAGFLFANSNSLEDKGIVIWIKEKALRLLTPYIFWTLIGLIPKYYFENKRLSGLTPGYVLRCIFIPRQNVWGHFWFLPVLFVIYLLFAIWRITTKEKQRIALPITIICTTIIYFLHVNVSFFGLTDICSSMVYFAVGILVWNLRKNNLGGGTTEQMVPRWLQLCSDSIYCNFC